MNIFKQRWFWLVAIVIVIVVLVVLLYPYDCMKCVCASSDECPQLCQSILSKIVSGNIAC